MPGASRIARTATRSAGTSAAIRAKLFANGRSQAVRLPKEFRLPGTEVLIRREGDRIILEPLPDTPRDAKGWPIGFWAKLDALGEGLDFPDVEPMPARLLAPDELDPLDESAR
jgi:antitoxin VapB